MTGVGRAVLVTAGAATAVLVADRVAKVAVERTLDEGQHVRGPLGIHLRRTTNARPITGGRPGDAELPVVLAAAAALAIGIAGAGVALRRPAALQIGAGMMAGGMAANLVDRARGDGVTDFLRYPGGVLNLADLALAAGFACAGLALAVR